MGFAPPSRDRQKGALLKSLLAKAKNTTVATMARGDAHLELVICAYDDGWDTHRCEMAPPPVEPLEDRSALGETTEVWPGANLPTFGAQM